jgi:hypothetical protein
MKASARQRSHRARHGATMTTRWLLWLAQALALLVVLGLYLLVVTRGRPTDWVSW